MTICGIVALLQCWLSERFKMDTKTRRSRLTTLLVCSLCAVFATAATPAARKPFVSFKAPGETVKNYDIVEPVILQHDNNELWPKELRVQIPSGTSTFTLYLQLNEELIAPHFTSQHYDQTGQPIIDKTHVNCFYHGRVEGHPDWTLVMSTCHGLRGSFGNLHDKEQYYHVEPLNPNDNSLEQPLALYLAREYRHIEGTCGSKDHLHDVDLPDYSETDVKDATQKRLRRQSRRIVEWLVVNDNRQYLQYGANLTRTILRSLEVANFVDMVYRLLNIRVVLVHVTTWTNGDQIPGGVVSNPDRLLDDFRDYVSNNLFNVLHDSAMLLTGINLDGSTVGIAFIRTMCDDRSSVGLSQDSGGGVDFVGSTAAHELGHIFNMQHDSPPRENCNCQDPSGGCIMAASSGSPAPTQWSQCSVTDLQNGFTIYALDRCLTNEPSMTVGDPVCGNGIREGDEVCDCGSIQECTDPCCNATACVLIEGAQCQEGPCCQSNCRFASYGTTCREPTNECDLLEFCTGDSSDCPMNVNKQDTTPCGDDDQYYCFSGFCKTYDEPCQLAFGGGSGKGSDDCFTAFNTDGNQFGNCGYNSVDFIACDPSDVFCGQLHCIPGNFQLDLEFSLTILTVSVGDQSCRSFTSNPGEDFMSPGLVQDGTRCGNQSLCFQQECIPISDPALNIQPKPIGDNGLICSGNGQANNLGQCSCIVGYTGTTCDTVVSSGSSGSNTGAIAGGIVGAILGTLLIAAILVMVAYYVMRRRSKSKWSTTRTVQSTPKAAVNSNRPPTKPSRNMHAKPGVTESTAALVNSDSRSTPPSRPPPHPSAPPPSDAKPRRPPPARPPPAQPPSYKPPPLKSAPPKPVAPPRTTRDDTVPEAQKPKPAMKPPITPRANPSSKPSSAVPTSKLQVQWPPPS